MPTEARSLEELELLVARSLGEHRPSPGARQRAYSRALALLDDEAARVDASQAPFIGFVCDLLAELLVELAADLPALTSLVHRLEVDANLSAFELGRELVRIPQLLRMPPTVAIDVELKLLVAFTEADAVSLWRQSSHDRPEPIACAGKTNPDDARTRRLARELLAEEPVDRPRGTNFAGLLVDGTKENVALLCRRGCAVAPRHTLLLEASMPVLAAILMQDARLTSSSGTEAGANHRKAQPDPAERRLTRVRFDLHDGPQQDLMLLAQDLRLFRSQVESLLTDDETRQRVNGRFDDLEARLIAVDGDLRRISVSTESPFLHSESLPKVLAHLTDAFQERTGIDPQVRLQGDFGDLTDSQHIALLGLIREALSNIREHAGAKHVSISLVSEGDGVKASVTDDGRGFDPEAALVEAARGGHLGLVGMHERVRLLGGHTRIDSRPGGPTVISVSLPAWPMAKSPRSEPSLAAD
jgi:signal transduction histidine kinase